MQYTQIISWRKIHCVHDLLTLVERQFSNISKQQTGPSMLCSVALTGIQQNALLQPSHGKSLPCHTHAINILITTVYSNNMVYLELAVSLPRHYKSMVLSKFLILCFEVQLNVQKVYGRRDCITNVKSWLYIEFPVLTVCKMRMRASYKTSAVTT